MTVIYSASLTGANTAWQGVNLRVVIGTGQLSAATGTLVRVTIKTTAGSNAGNIDSCWIGEQGTGSAWVFDGNQVQLKFAGAVNKTGITGAQTIVTDSAAFTYAGTGTPLVVAFHCSGTEIDGADAAITGNATYSKAAADESSTTAPITYNLSSPTGETVFISQIEILDMPFWRPIYPDMIMDDAR